MLSPKHSVLFIIYISLLLFILKHQMMDKVHETNVIYHCQNVTEKHVPSSYIHSNFFSVFDHLGILSIYTRICFSAVSSVTLSRRFIQFCLCSCVLIFIHCISCFFPISPFVIWSSHVQSLATFEYLISTDLLLLLQAV